MINYVWSDRCPYQYAVFPEKPFFIVQFHPELWKKTDNELRVRIYQEKYGMTDDELQKQLALFGDAPDSQYIIQRFIDRVVEPRHLARQEALAPAGAAVLTK